MELFWNRDRRVVILATANLRTAPTGRTYQLWGIVPCRAPRSLGTIAGDASGRSVVMLPVPADLDMKLAAVTEEPAGGSPQPTSAPFVAGSVRER